jgi:nuclear pore complex protein Nup188
VTPDEDGPYNIKQIKDDALWLAGQTKEDEVAALRIVVLEWQKRSTMRLLSRPLNAETLTGTEMGGMNFEDSIFAPKSLLAGGAQNMDESSTALESTQQRRFRLLSLYLSERLHILKTSELRVRLYAYAEHADVDGRYEAYKGDKVGKLLFDQFCPNEDGSESIVKGVDALRKSLARTEPGKPMPTIEDMQPFVEGSWIESHMLQSINILQFIFTVSDFSSKIPSAKAVLSFFELMEKFNFFGAIPELVSNR